MNSITYHSNSIEDTLRLGRSIGERLRGGEVLELISDLGGGKTTFTRGLADGFGSTDPVSSPSFTISYVYSRSDGKKMYHFDFYRLEDAGIVGNELSEVENDESVVTVVEWGDIVHDILPRDRIVVRIKNIDDSRRELIFKFANRYSRLFT
ncbi:tRNA (adenosine(37)-N6)-threonylcarbamoyltransferase complex ATPase subunit type 1 TsaE [Candidatus Nomurabacteria bacterium]|nr:tRNA (adenosine(37)-N6)-threonylcarbamoyltransferase complex ATPase subunit type 1 TsaE [Candidatus Saccharibacteria bacterium]MCA9313106.1 tRNA (adenosine(37)-N6)-threonylcarbamoyltransferase complex ATPase subunit type 1 TsaE [Candidatus Saccharibacteria bacterium]MCB9822028.1 tRNA (adenosine(37)-N6)-threonylcarbamoyltransferase complex ATPase subunit type 1 TsaE [Candidatus Nomurabacteria bacterium]